MTSDGITHTFVVGAHSTRVGEVYKMSFIGWCRVTYTTPTKIVMRRLSRVEAAYHECRVVVQEKMYYLRRFLGFK